MFESIPFISQFGLAVALAYAFFLMYLLRQEETSRKNIKEYPAVAVLVAFRNEAANLEECINSLKSIDYPEENLEIIMLDDSSEDDSFQVAQNTISDDARFRLLKVTENKDDMQGKMNALAFGIEKTEAQFLFVTDADCQVNRGWIKNILSHFDENTAMVSGFTIVESKSARQFHKLQTFDWAFLQGLAVYTSRTGRTITVLGNNLAFTRKAYREVGGFEAIKFSLTEDHALMKAIQQKTNYRVKYVFDPDSPVISKPLEKFADFIQQRIRWSRGGLQGRLLAFGTVGSVFFAHLFILILFAAMNWDYVAGTAIGLIIGIDYLFSRRVLSEMNLENYKSLIVKYELFLIIYTILLVVLTFIPLKVNWKGRKY